MTAMIRHHTELADARARQGEPIRHVASYGDMKGFEAAYARSMRSGKNSNGGSLHKPLETAVLAALTCDMTINDIMTRLDVNVGVSTLRECLKRMAAARLVHVVEVIDRSPIYRKGAAK